MDIDELFENLMLVKTAKEIRHEYYINNRDKFRGYQKNWSSQGDNKKNQHEYRRKWRKENPDRVKLHDRRVRLKSKYKLTPEKWNELFILQGSVCLICKTNKPGKKGWQTDHCHNSGKIRGILCGPCNVSLGGFKDDPILLEIAAAYIRRWN